MPSLSQPTWARVPERRRAVANGALLTLLAFSGLLFGCESRPVWDPVARVFHDDLSESSGVARSDARKDVWFTHNDSGGAPELFAFTIDGRLLDVHPVNGAQAQDWEDMASGPCPGDAGSCLYLADIGDNARVRDSVQVYAAPVPGESAETSVLAVWELTYPEGPRNAETLLVDPLSARMYIVTKSRSGKSEVYRLPTEPGAGELIRVAALRFTGKTASDRLTTGGDWHPDGDRLVIRTYTTAYEWQVDPDDRESHWGSAPRRIALPEARQGEAIAYDGNGGLLTSSEGQPMLLWLTPAPAH